MINSNPERNSLEPHTVFSAGEDGTVVTVDIDDNNADKSEGFSDGHEEVCDQNDIRIEDLFAYARSLFNQGDWHGAISIASGILKQAPHSSAVQTLLGAAYFELRAYNKSEKHLTAALRLNDHDPEAHFYISFLYDAREDGFSSLYHIQRTLDYGANDDFLIKKATLRFEQLCDKYNNRRLISRYPKLSSYGSYWLGLISLSTFLCFGYTKTQEAWLLVAAMSWSMACFLYMFVISRTNRIDFWPYEVRFSHFIFGGWRVIRVTETPIKYVQITQLWTDRNLWDLVSNNTKIHLQLLKEVTLPFGDGQSPATKGTMVIESIGTVQFMAKLFLCLEECRKYGILIQSSAAPDLPVHLVLRH